MPKVQRRDLPLALLNHLLDRISDGPFPVTNSKNLLIGWILSQKFPMAGGSNGYPECVSAVKASS